MWQYYLNVDAENDRVGILHNESCRHLDMDSQTLGLFSDSDDALLVARVIAADTVVCPECLASTNDTQTCSGIPNDEALAVKNEDIASQGISAKPGPKR